MIVYHVDKMSRLYPGYTIKRENAWKHQDSVRDCRIKQFNRFYEGKLSFFGVQSLDAFPDKVLDIEPTELLLDYVRAIHFPGLPSRFTVFFASSSAEDAMKWFSSLSLSDCAPQLLALETFGKVYAANVLFRDEVSNRVSALFEEYRVRPMQAQPAHSPNPLEHLSALGSTCLFRCMDAAMSYWSSLRLVHGPSDLPHGPNEELLCVPPLRVLRRM